MNEREMQNEILSTLSERAAWYRDGCPHLEDRADYYASGDCARDAASDLETALSEIRVLEAVIVKLRATLRPSPDHVSLDAVRQAIGFLSMPHREMVMERLGQRTRGEILDEQENLMWERAGQTARSAHGG